MCNAWNHPMGCTCGWGGEGHLGRRAAGLGWSIPTGYSVSSKGIGYVNPNAHCPVCGASVYFYQSPDGGRVFFESLGPPWPKHPCTDRGAAVRYASSQDVELSTALMARSAPVGWEAFACDAISEVPHKKGTYELNGLFGDVRLKVFVQVSGLQLRAPYLCAHLRPISTASPLSSCATEL